MSQYYEYLVTYIDYSGEDDFAHVDKYFEFTDDVTDYSADDFTFVDRLYRFDQPQVVPPVYYTFEAVKTPTFGTHSMAVGISQPQLYRINSILRGIEDTKNLNLEMQSTAYDLYNLYYKQNITGMAFDADMAYLKSATPVPTDLSITVTLSAYDVLLADIVDLDRRVQALEGARTTSI